MSRSASAASAMACIALSALATGAYACGDKLAMMGGGVSFERLNQSAHPGTVLLVPASGDASSTQMLALKRSLERAGHRVLLAADPGAARESLRDGNVDVVLVESPARFDGSLVRSDARATSGPAVIAVAFGAPAASDATRTASKACVVQADKQRGQKVLGAVEDAVERQRRGLPSACPAPQTPSAI